MYGYVVPFKPQLSTQDFVLYRSFYCGLCIDTGKTYGQLPRFTTNYDMVFLALVCFDVLNEPVEFKECVCVLNPVKKKPVVVANPLLDKLTAVNAVLSYYKAEDGVIDGEGMKYGLLKKILKKPYLKAKETVPDVDAAVREEYENLRLLEKEGKAGPDRAAHPFATMLARIAKCIMGDKADENITGLFYNTGKFVYLTDALDDKDDDDKKGRFNPFTSVYGKVKRKELIKDKKADLEFLFATIVNRAAECFNGIRCNQSYTLLRNIIYYGMREKAEELLSSEKKLPPPKI